MTRILSSLGVALVVLVPAPSLAQQVERGVVRDYAAELTCAPEAAIVPPAQLLRITGGVEPTRALFSPGDAVILNAGTSQGVKDGQMYRVRRVIVDRFASAVSGGLQPVSLHTAGWVRVESTQSLLASATVVRACDSVETGDFLEPLVLPELPVAVPDGQPDFSTPGHLILGDERRQIGGAGSMMVLDRGSDHGVKLGQRLTVFRQTVSGIGPVHRIAEATAVIVYAETAIVRIDSSRDAVYVGDLVALHR